MLLIPAVDIKDGRCVRLVRGDMQNETVYADSPLSQVKRWIESGAKRIHIVDLNGAVEGRPVNSGLIGDISRRFPHIEFQVGGGIRDLKTAGSYLDAGVQFVILGTRAVAEPSFIGEMQSRYPGRVIAGLDVKDGVVATEGWLEAADANLVELALELEKYGAAAIVYTDIQRDGMLSGVNIEATAALAAQVSIPVIASGGIRDLEDVKNLLNVCQNGILGAIAGKSLYEGTLNYQDGVKLINQSLNRTS